MVKMGSTGAMNKKKLLMSAAVVVLVSLASGGERAAAEVHHVVGNDHGWATSTDLDSWISGRVFKIGDILWFAYSSASESIMELQTLEEFLSCDLTNPIRLYTKGLDNVPLDSQGTRYFTSGNLKSCKDGLKLPITVQPGEKKNETLSSIVSVAEAPASPSAAAAQFSTRLSFALLVGLVVSYMVI